MSIYQHTFVVSCLVRNQRNAVLAVRHHQRGWELPQGRVEIGENLLNALYREVEEETGIRIKAPEVAAIWSKTTSPVAVIHGFIARYGGGDLSPSPETPEVAWLSVGQALKLFDHPINRDRLLDLLTFKGRVRFYSYSTGPYSKTEAEI